MRSGVAAPGQSPGPSVATWPRRSRRRERVPAAAPRDPGGPRRERLHTAVLTPSGPGAAVLEAWRSERFALLVSPPILDEVARVLAYPKIARRHRWSRKEIVTFVRELGHLAIVTPGRLRLLVIAEDPDDDRYLECAVEGRAGYVVSGDRHLLALGTYRDIAIVSPRAFLAVLPATRSR